MSLLLGIDVGTSSTKAIIIDLSGTVLAAAAAEHPISRPRDGWAEQDPDWWWRSTVDSIRAVLQAARSGSPRAATEIAPRIAAIGISGQMHGSVFLPREALGGDGSNAHALRPAILWNDQRTAQQCAEIEQRIGGRRALVELVGNAALPGFTLPKYLWLRAHEPRTADRIAAVILPKDFVRLRMTGIACTDVGDASGTLLFDIDRRDWSAAALDGLGIDPAIWPVAHESGRTAGTLTDWAAAALGLPPGIPIAAGSGDNMCGAVGAGVVEPGLIAATLGTSGVIYAHTDAPLKDLPAPVATTREPATPPRLSQPPPGRTHAMCAATGTPSAPQGWCITGCMLSAAGSLHWARDTIAPNLSFDDLLREAAEAPPGCDGVTFLPYLTGERCPHPDPDVRGAWLGLSARHSRAHLIRAVLEGVTFGMVQMLDIILELDPTPASSAAATRPRSLARSRPIRIGGGGARSPLWRQLQADIYRSPLELPNTEEGPAFGAALLAGVARGLWPDLATACRATILTTTVAEPATAGTDALAEARARFEAGYSRVAK